MPSISAPDAGFLQDCDIKLLPHREESLGPEGIRTVSPRMRQDSPRDRHSRRILPDCWHSMREGVEDIAKTKAGQKPISL